MIFKHSDQFFRKENFPAKKTVEFKFDKEKKSVFKTVVLHFCIVTKGIFNHSPTNFKTTKGILN